MSEGDSSDRGNLESLLSKAADPTRAAPASEIARWSGRLPPLLLDIWRRYGLVRLAGRRLRLIEPSRYAPLMAYIFHGDPDFEGDTHAIALGDFGGLALWSERHGFAFLNPQLASVEAPFLLATDPPPSDAQIADMLIAMPEAAIEAFDPAGEPLHARLLARLGRLDHDDIYAATPAPSQLGGTPEPDYIVADALEWLEAVYTEMNVMLVDMSRNPIELRMIGQPWQPERPQQLRGGKS
ncbi:hypothetical protein FQV27_13525 [Paracoccus aurantiacus]|uniref:GAD-related domain-containing protein n=1 Tax=Paracoccus aurantiacus TaxID=2599412 RepID=A0A5C6S031_9RHOB|nr:GAD-like domain-containing protein [Paracoccus aurantiacus]TXB68196.1 hypothetical protein FQV27_13525 [Paracoccus aurantiacus]